jgi:sulfite reductase (NADPH) flavoprotein alpha-component
MTVQLPIDENALTLEQWRQVDALAPTLTPSQARWISGYFAGLDAGLQRAGLANAEPAPEARSLTILYGSETGNSRELAKGLAATASERGLSPRLAEMADYKLRRIKDEQDLLVIVSTHGEGDPPEPAAGFFDYLESGRAPRLEQLRFSVLALGDSTYETYCEAGKRLDRRLEELGASRLHERVDCDIDYEEAAARWSQNLLECLGDRAGTIAARAALASFPTAVPVHDKKHPFGARVLENIRIVGRGSTKETRHVELDLSGSGICYEPGDSLGILPSNEGRLVDALLEATGLPGDAEVIVKGSCVSLRSALTSRFEIAAASPRFIQQWAKLTGSRELAALLEADLSGECVRFLARHHVIDIVRRFPAGWMEPLDFLAGLRPLQPRLYSLASSRKSVGEEAHLAIAPLRYELHGSVRGGIASTQVADRIEVGDVIPVYFQENPHFRLPSDDVPIVMVGPGTGVAPFRAFLQEREARGACGKSWLFFGERNLRSDFLYQLEWQQWLKQGVLTRLDVAFSRDCEKKIYVQHRMIEQAAELFDWLEQGAHFYVCGDEKKMARDVHETLLSVIEQAGGRSREDAQDYIRRLQSERRYQRDIY